MTTGAESVDSSTSAIQAEGDGAIPISALHIHPIPWTIAKSFLVERHYLHRIPLRCRVSLGVFSSDKLMAPLVGVMMWGNPIAANRIKDGEFGLELTRMFLTDECPKNSESRCLGFARRWIKKHFPEKKFLLAYSDIEGMGHKGTIYKAAGWTMDRITVAMSWKNRPEKKGRDRGSNTRKLRWRLDL